MHKTTENYTEQAAPRHWRLTGFSTPKPVKNQFEKKTVPPSNINTVRVKFYMLLFCPFAGTSIVFVCLSFFFIIAIS